MEIKKHDRRTLRGEDIILSEVYKHNLQLYDKTPTSEILLHEFEEMALDRLKALKAIDTVNLRGFVKFSKEWCTNLKEELNKQGLKDLAKLYFIPALNISGLTTLYKLRQKDHVSHFILCMAFCRTDELRNWFMSRELELFQARFEVLEGEELQSFININNLEFKPIPAKEKNAKKEKLETTFQYIKPDAFSNTDFYKVPFRKVIELLRNRRVYLEKGQCYVSASDLGSVLTSKLRQNMSHSLAVLRHSLPETKEDYRLDSVLRCLLDHYESGSYRPNLNPTDVLQIEDLNEVSRKSFPPCMRRLHEALTTKHHLRHSGRQQYQLFLKGAGLPMEECLRFWRNEFVKVMAADKFEREHAYNIRHNYGQEGNRTNYSPYGCNKIIQSQPGPDDYHGCPFRHCKPQDLRRLLLSYGISSKGLAEVMEHNDNQLYTLACQKLFVLTHEKEKAVEFGLYHPNQYFSESRTLLLGNKAPTAVSTPSSTFNSPAATPGSSKSTVNTPQGTPLTSKSSSASRVTSTPTSRRTLNPNSSKPAADVKVMDSAMEVSDWLDEADGDMLDSLVAMETQ